MKNLSINYIFLAILICCLFSCTRYKKYSITGDYESKSLKPTIVISDSSDSVIKSDNLKNGEIMLRGNLGQEGFHQVLVHYDDEKKTKFYFPIWLSGEDLEFHFSKNLQEYPIIKSENEIQNSLSKYYKILMDESAEANIELASANARAVKFGDVLRDEAFNQLYYDVDAANQKLEDAQYTALNKFAKLKPSTQVLFYLIKETSLDLLNRHPESYLAMLKSIESDFKNDNDHIDLVTSLNKKLKIKVGNQIDIHILGIDLKGNKFNSKILKGKKVILLEFWKAGNDLSRRLRVDYNRYYKEYSPLGFEIIGVSLDKKENWWRAAIKDDQVSWPQYADLKGSDSDNLDYYNIDVIPNNILITVNGEILDINVPLLTLGLDLEKYLKTTQKKGIIN